MIAFHQMKKKDIHRLVKLRSEVLIAANTLDKNADMKAVEEQTAKFYRGRFREQVTYFAETGNVVISCGSICFYTLMPTWHNPAGKYAYIMNMYTKPAYRRKGIAYTILDLLVKTADRRGISHIALEATEAGRPLYEKYGFRQYGESMILPM